MFEPGHLHPGQPARPRPAGHQHPPIRYEVRQNAESGAYVHFDMDGEIDGKPFSDSLRAAARYRLQLRQRCHAGRPEARPAPEVRRDHPGAQGIRCDVRGHSRQAACPSADRWISSGSFATSEPSPAAGSMGKTPISTISGLFRLPEKPFQGLATLAAGEQHALAAYGLPLNKLKLLRI